MPIRYAAATTGDWIALFDRDITTRPAVTARMELTVNRLASESGVRVLLSGWGGDELASFNGRGFYADLFWRGKWGTLVAGSQGAGSRDRPHRSCHVATPYDARTWSSGRFANAQPRIESHHWRRCSLFLSPELAEALQSAGIGDCPVRSLDQAFGARRSRCYGAGT